MKPTTTTRWPTPPDIPSVDAATKRLAEATQLHAAGKVEEAVEAAWSAAECDELSLQAHYAIGNWLIEASRWKEAAEAWHSALSIADTRKTRFEILERIADVYEGQGDETKAEELRRSIAKQRATREDPAKEAASTLAYFGPEDPAGEIRPLAAHTVWRRRVLRTHSLPPDNTSHPNPLAAGDLLLVGMTHGLYALDRQTGTKRWHFTAQPYGHQPRLAADVVIFPTTHTVFGLRLSDGAKLWEWCPYGRTHEWIYSSPVLGGDRFFIGDRTGKVHAIQSNSGKVLWSFDMGPKVDVNSTGTVLGDNFVIANNSGRVVALERKTGDLAWEATLPRGSIAELLPLGDGVAVETFVGIFLLGPDGAIRKKLELTAMGRYQGTRESSSAFARHPSGGSIHVIAPDGSDSRLFAAGIRVKAVRFDPALGQLLEGRYDGLGIVAPDGERVLHLRSEQIAFRENPEYVSGMLYAVADNPLAVYAVRISSES